jgi:hypothetical protein
MSGISGRSLLDDLSPEELALAAYCGHPGARAILAAPMPPEDLREWTTGLGRWPMAGERAAVEAVRLAIERNVDQVISPSFFAAANTAIDAVKTWLECPCETHERQAERRALAVATGWTGEAFDYARTSAHFLGPHRPSYIDHPMPQFVRAVMEAAAGCRGDQTLRRRMEAALLRWIGLESR